MKCPDIPILSLDSVSSTNLYALENADHIHDLTLITASQQTDGRGRQGRLWLSPPSQNLYATWVIKNWNHPQYQINWILSLATILTIQTVTPQVKPWIKWPNDIFIRHCKLAGLLAECRILPQCSTPFIAAGIGLNLNMTANEIKQINQPATSLLNEVHTQIDYNFFIKQLVFHLSRLYFISQESGTKEIHRQWKEFCLLQGKEIFFITPSGDSFKGLVLDLPFSGEIVIHSHDGIHSYQCGDIAIDKNHFPSNF